jgi:hypothetical protein
MLAGRWLRTWTRVDHNDSDHRIGRVRQGWLFINENQVQARGRHAAASKNGHEVNIRPMSPETGRSPSRDKYRPSTLASLGPLS